MLELALIGGDKVPPPAADWIWSQLNLQIAPEAPEKAWTRIHPSHGAGEVTGSTHWSSADGLKPNYNNLHDHHRHNFCYIFEFLRHRSKSLKTYRGRSKRVKRSVSWLPEGICPESFQFFIHLVKSEKERTWLKDEAQLGSTSLSLPFHPFLHNDFRILKRGSCWISGFCLLIIQLPGFTLAKHSNTAS